MGCGAALPRTCPSCGAEAPADARFCVVCGSSLEQVARAAPAAAVNVGAKAAEPEERRLVTVLFADLSGYTSVAERLDHETVKSLIEPCLTRLAGEVQRYAGRVDKFIGDSVMAVFGAPVTHEDDAERAVRAAMGMRDAMSELNGNIGTELGFELGLRVGVNTGEVLAGRMGDAYTVVGDTVNVAARLQSAAPMGGILVGKRTYASTSEAIHYRPLEPLSLKGKAAPVGAWEVTGLRTPVPRRERRGIRSPLVGRDDELSQLERIFARMGRNASPQLVMIIGQAGIGKTRLLREFEQRLERDNGSTRVLHGRCLAFGSTVAYWPVSEMLRGECEIVEGDTGTTAREKLVASLEPLIADLEGAEEAQRRLAMLMRLVGAEPPAGHPQPEQDDEQSSRESFFGAVRATIEALAQGRPLVLAWEDIHWADEGTLDLIDYLSHWLRMPVLQLCLARDELFERRPDWGSPRRSATVMFLEPLLPSEARELIGSLLQQSKPAADVLDALAERSGGNPLFAETVAQRIVEEGGSSEAELPDTMHGLLAARLDALDSLERELVAHASVAGRTFWESVLWPVADAYGADLDAALQALREKDIIVPADLGPRGGEPELSFKHVLIRDVAYGMLPKAVRARKHAQVGAFIEQRAGDREEGVAALLAEHYRRAATLAAEVRLGKDEIAPVRAKAVLFGETAGDASAALFANLEALAHYEAAAAFAHAGEATRFRISEKGGDVALRLGRVETAIESWQPCLQHWREQGDLLHVAELHRKIGAALAHKGERKAAIEQYQQGINLIKDQPASLELVRLYEEAAWLYMHVGDNMLAIYASEKALRLAEELGELAAASRAHGIFGRVFGRIGDIEKARENLERAVELAQDSDQIETVLALLALGHHLEHSEGDYEAAHMRYLEGLGLAERIGELPSQIEFQAALAQLAFYRCDWEEVRRASDASAQLAEREGLVGKLCLPNTLRGLLMWRDGDFGASARLFGEAHRRAKQIGWSEVAFNALLGLATTLRDRGDLETARQTLDEALALSERAGLVAQSIQAHAAIALVCALAADSDGARGAAKQAAALSLRARSLVGEAAALEARGLVEVPPTAFESLSQARDAWERMGRHLDAARCELQLGRRLRAGQPDAAAEVLSQVADRYQRLGIQHLAEQTRAVVEA
jgi:adenylate cyclase